MICHMLKTTGSTVGLCLRLLLLTLGTLFCFPHAASAAPEKTRPFVVVIDPGHGGKDSGAVGPSGVYEKDLVLAIGRRLRDFIRHESSMRAVMTRMDDSFVDLRKRAQIARDAHADLFVSLHADAFEDTQARGSSVYILSERGASSEAARTLADRENAGELGGVDLGAEDPLLASVLVDLSKNATRESSARAASAVMQSLVRNFRIHSPSVQKAAFRVLKSLDVPSMLIETGFISSLEEEKRLNDSHYQDQLARAIFNGIRKSISKN